MPSNLPTFSMTSALAFMVTGTTCFLWGTAQSVPEQLIALNLIVVSFFFGNKQGKDQTVNAVNAALAAPTLPAPYIPEAGK